MRRDLLTRLLVVAALTWSWGGTASAQTAKSGYESARTLEAEARQLVAHAPASSPAPVRAAAVRATKRAIVRYDAVVRRHPTSGYADNALWQAADLSRLLFDTYQRVEDRTAALKYYAWLAREYPTSGLGRQARAATRTFGASRAPDVKTVAATPPAPPAPAPVAVAPPTPPPVPAVSVAVAPVTPPGTAQGAPTLNRIDRLVLGGLVRFTLHVDGEPAFAHDVIDGPPRAYVDILGVVPSPPLADAAQRYDDSAVRQVRVGRQTNGTRVVLDLAGAPVVSVFTLRNPYRIVVDADATPASAAQAAAPAVVEPVLALLPAAFMDPALATPGPTVAAPPPLETPVPDVPRAAGSVAGASAIAAPPEPAIDVVPTAPAANRDGSFSLARQLGLGVSRIVIDPGHGGHDPGTLLSGTNEAAIVLDVALRLERLLKKEPGLDVVLTRRTNTFIPLEERTAIANREGADLFLSIHANASRNGQARGVETYYLSFASNPDAEAVAARENATSARDMHSLPGIVRAIALNNKLDESRDLAVLVQQSLTTRLPDAGQEAKSRGVKKAPFVVLIGAGMPSILTEIGFLTNKTEAGLLKTPAHRQRVAEALHASVLAYRKALKQQTAVATR